MVRQIVRLAGLALLVASGFWSSTAHAQYGVGLGFYNYSNGFNARPPYYAIFPPVYYSYPVARPYGFSPFAYPPGVMTPDVKPNIGPLEIKNPYVPERQAPQSDQTVEVGRMYINPFVKQCADAGTSSLARRSP